MTKPAPTPSFSAADAAFLYLERKEIPLHIASVCIFDGPIPFAQFVANIDAKLHLIPRYLQIPVVSTWNLEFPVWQYDPHFDVRRHVFHVTLDPPGGEAELQALAGRILSELLDRSKPLWDVYVVDGLKDGRGAIIWRVHHALADGVSGAELMRVLLDPTAEITPIVQKPRRRKPPTKSPPHPSSSGISATINSTLKSLLEFEAGLLALAQHLFEGTKQTGIKDLVGLLPEYTASIERLPFNKPCTGARKFCWTEWDIADVQAVREALGGTINDVILAVLTRALARYAKLHGESVVNRFVRIVCPVNLRQADQNSSLGNQISFLPLALPLDARGPIRMLQGVTSRTEALKRCGALGFAGLAAKWFAAAPPPLHALFWQNIPDVIFPVPLLNMICTNVVGSPTPLYAIGRRMLAAYPQVPTGWDLGVGVAVHSYDGRLFFGFIADTHAAPDVERLRDFLVLSFQELRRSAAMKKSRSLKTAPRAARPQQKRPSEPAVAALAPTSAGSLPPAGPVVSTAGHNKEAA
jgi:diacylglycerol O-acyltransferase